MHALFLTKFKNQYRINHSYAIFFHQDTVDVLLDGVTSELPAIFSSWLNE
jgi:hypothetical protein